MASPPIRRADHAPASTGVTPPKRPRSDPPQHISHPDFDHREDAGAADPRPAGLDALVADALGPVTLPGALRLIASLETASARVAGAESGVPGLSDLVRGVIDEEIAKLTRYVDMSGS